MATDGLIGMTSHKILIHEHKLLRNTLPSKLCRDKLAAFRAHTLHPGDVVWLGAEGATPNMRPGDVVEIEISGIGTLRNYVVAEE
jgi:hypothetical protein